MKRHIDDKRIRALVIEQHRHLLGLPPCGCIFQPIPCDCPPECCRCAVELVICNHAEDWNDDEQDAFEEGLAGFLRAVDPWNYLDPPEDTARLPSPTRNSRLTLYTARVEAGFSPCRTMAKDLDATKLKVSETIRNLRNGAVVHCGVQSVFVAAKIALPETPSFNDVHRMRCMV